MFDLFSVNNLDNENNDRKFLVESKSIVALDVGGYNIRVMPVCEHYIY